MANQTINNSSRRLSSQPFMITISQPWLLQTDELNYQTGHALSKKSMRCHAKLSIVAYSHQQLSLRAGDDPEIVTLTLQARQLTVTCNCAQPVDTICPHACRVLFSIAGNEDFLIRYRPNGPADLAQKYPALFTKNKKGYGNDYQPIPLLNTVYGLDHGLVFDLPPAVFLLKSVPPSNLPPAGHGLCFIIVESYRSNYWNETQGRMPALLPCRGILNKAGNSMKGFHQFLSGTSKTEQQFLTANEQQLNNTGLEIWKLVEQLPNSIKNCTPAQQQLLQQLFHLWQTTLPLLHAQPHVFNYPLHWLRDLKNKPRSSRMMQCQVQKDRPQLKFSLQDKGPYYSLRPQLWLRETLQPTFEHCNPLFVSVGNHYYLMASLMDAAMLAWFHPGDNHITVFKEHFVAFQKEILQPLATHYTIIKTVAKNVKQTKS